MEVNHGVEFREVGNGVNHGVEIEVNHGVEFNLKLARWASERWESGIALFSALVSSGRWASTLSEAHPCS